MRCIAARRRRPQHQTDAVLGADAGKAAAVEPAGAAVHCAGDRPAVRRLSRSRLCQGAARRRAAAERRGDRVLLPGRQLAARAVRPAALHFRQLYPCRVVSVGARAQRHHPAGGQTRRGRRHALQPELQHRHHAGPAARARRRPAAFKLVAQVNSELPFMPGAGDLPADEFSAVLDSPATEFPLFAPPAEPISDTKYAIGLHAAGLVRDGGTLQIGIGQIGDALAQGLMVRHRDNAQFQEILQRLPGGAVGPARETGPFETGPLWRQRNAVRGVSWPDRCRHSQARGRRRGAARRVFSRAEIVLPRAARDAAGPAGTHPDDAGVLHQRTLTATRPASAAPASMPASSTTP